MKTKGINHLALVCRDMTETVKFYTEALGMPLAKTVGLPAWPMPTASRCRAGGRRTRSSGR
jgi:catechol 2,3-dioxygenase-like lactoylglutathione lyase family enzyme